MLKEEAKSNIRVKKILVFGTAEAGKSTVMQHVAKRFRGNASSDEPTSNPNDMEVASMGVHEERRTIKGTDFFFVDVGGQQNERRKWIHLFDGFNCIMFV